MEGLRILRVPISCFWLLSFRLVHLFFRPDRPLGVAAQPSYHTSRYRRRLD